MDHFFISYIFLFARKDQISFLLSLKYFLIEKIIALQDFLVFCKHQQESVIGTLMFPPSQNSLPCPSPSHLSRLSQSPCLSSLSHTANSHWLSLLHMVMYVSILLSPYIPLLPPPLALSVSLFSMSVSLLLLCK